MGKRLVTSDLQLNRMDAQRHAKKHGKTLVSHPLLDEGVMRGRVKGLTYAREWLVYPATGSTFRKKRDIFDPQTDSRLPWSDVKDLDIFRPNIGLFVDPEDLDIHKKTGGIVLLPESITIFENFIQKSDAWVKGKPDEKTLVPLTVSSELWNSLSANEQRWFWRAAEQGVRPLVRDYGVIEDYNGWRGVVADGQPHSVCEVAFEEDTLKAGVVQTDELSKQLSISRESGRLIIEGTPEQLDAAVKMLGQLKEQ